MKKDPLSWSVVSTRYGPEIPLFNVRLDTLLHPESGAALERLVLEANDWVNVIAVTADDRIIMVEQFRFGIGAMTTEPVGGLVDPGEDSLAAGQRELLEEAGYGGGRWKYLGNVQANPAIHNNLCHHWLAEGVERLQDPTPDDGEAIRVHQMTLEEVKAAIANGAFRHPLGLSAMARVFPLWNSALAQDCEPG